MVDRGPEHPVFSLADNRLLAHPQRGGGLVVLAGSAGFAKYVRFGKPKLLWKLRRDIDGRKVALPARGASLVVPLITEQVDAKAVYLRLYSRSGTKVRLALNGKRTDVVPVEAGWSTVTVELPADALIAGENVVGFEARGRAPALEWLQIGGVVSDDTPIAYDARANALVLPEGDGLAYYAKVPDKGRLTGTVSGEGCAVHVRATAHDGTAEGTLEGTGNAVDLSAVAGKVVRLDLRADGCSEARLSGAALSVPGEASTVTRAAKPKYIVFWIMDTLRADRIKLFKPGARADVPAWERLADRGVVFRNAYVQGNESQASHASIWTSVYPVLHNINISNHGGPWQLNEKLEMMGRLMKKAGLYTTGVTANGFITVGARYGSGFKAFSNPMRDGHGKRVNGKIPASLLWKKALKSLDGKTDEPFFLFLGTIDTHKPWVAREPWISKYDPKPYKGKYRNVIWGGDVGVEKGRMISRQVQTPRDMERIWATYDCGVSYQDEHVGHLLDKLEEWGIADETMIIITADHGEEMWEEGRVGHGASLRQSLVWIPLIVSYPPLLPPGTIEEGVETIDILPTMLDALGIDVPNKLQGESLIPLAQGVGRGYPRPSIATQYQFQHVMNLGGWKLWARKKKKDADRVRLYDLENDPDERTDMYAARPIEARFVTDPLGLFLIHRRDWKKTRWGVASNMKGQIAVDLDGG